MEAFSQSQEGNNCKLKWSVSDYNLRCKAQRRKNFSEAESNVTHFPILYYIAVLKTQLCCQPSVLKWITKAPIPKCPRATSSYSVSGKIDALNICIWKQIVGSLLHKDLFYIYFIIKIKISATINLSDRTIIIMTAIFSRGKDGDSHWFFFFLILKSHSSTITGVNSSMLITRLEIASMPPRVPAIRKLVRSLLRFLWFKKNLLDSVVIKVWWFVSFGHDTTIIPSNANTNRSPAANWTTVAQHRIYKCVCVFLYQEMDWLQHTCFQSCRWKM